MRVEGKWYFSTRENFEMGPYESHEEAGFDLTLFISRANESDLMGKKRQNSVNRSFTQNITAIN